MRRHRGLLALVVGSLAVFGCGGRTWLGWGPPAEDAGLTEPTGAGDSSSGSMLTPGPDASSCPVPPGGSAGPGAMPVLVAQIPAPAGIVVDANSAYVTTNNAGPLFQMHLDGTGLTQMANQSASPIAVNQDNVFTVSPLGGNRASQGYVLGYSKTQSNLWQILAAGFDTMRGVAADDANVYWTNQDGLAGKTTGVFAAKIDVLMGCGQLVCDPPLVLSVAGPAGAIVVSAGRAFYAGATEQGKGAGSEGLMSVATSGGTVTVLVPPDPAYNVAAIAVDCVNVYYTTTAGTLARIPIDGGTPTTLATGVSAALQLGLDADRVYFATPQGLSAVPIEGGPVTTLVSGASPAGIAVDAHDVYWTDTGAGTVMKVAK